MQIKKLVLKTIAVLLIAGTIPGTAIWAADDVLIRTEKPVPGVRLDVFELGHGTEFVHQVWVYQPDPLPSTPIPIVIVPPAGGNLFTAPFLTDGDQPEHIPYVQAGFAVVSFAMKGQLTSDATDSEIVDAALAFRAGRAGIDDATAALDLALRTLPTVNNEAIFAAGHSSAATLVLLLAVNDDRIRGVAAYAPIWDTPKFIGHELVQALDEFSPGYSKFLEWSSPSHHLQALDVPIMLFHAEDDQVAPYKDTLTAVNHARAAGVKVEFRSVESGGHYDSMISNGIPAAIPWMQKRKSP